jgi:polysaccharide pyruvyl transferase WcaK-like protein
VAQELVGDLKQVQLSPDVAFSLEVVRPAELQVEPPLTGSMPAGVIGLNVNGLMYNGGYSRKNMFGLTLQYAEFLTSLITALLAEHSGELWLIPHTFAAVGNVESDPDASTRVRESLPPALQERVRIVTKEYDAHELKGIIGQCDFFIGSRMHSCIAALSQGVPCVGVAYSMKFAGVFESVGMEEWVVDGREFSNSEAIARVLELYHRRDEVREDLARRADDARKQLKEVFREIVESCSDTSGNVGHPRESGQVHPVPTGPDKVPK